MCEEASQYEFESSMRQQLLLAEEKLSEGRSLVSPRPYGSTPPVRRLGQDATPLSPLDAVLLAQRFLRK